MAQIKWVGSTTTTNIPFTAYTVAANSSHLTTSSSPTSAYPTLVTVTATNSLSLNQWVFLNGCQQGLPGDYINRKVGQVVASSGSSFSISVPTIAGVGSYTSTGCTATQLVPPVIATDNANNFNGFYARMSNIEIFAGANQINFYVGYRPDSGSGLHSVQFNGSFLAAYYASNAIDMTIDGASRVDGNYSFGGIYLGASGGDWNVDGGSYTTNSEPNNPPGTLGASTFIVDDSNCNAIGQQTRMHFSNTTWEADGNFFPGEGGVKVYRCKNSDPYPDLYLTMNGGGIFCGVGNQNGANCPILVVSPQSDTSVQLSLQNVSVSGGSGVNITPPFVGVPALIRQYLADFSLNSSNGYPLTLNYAPTLASFASISSQGNQTFDSHYADLSFANSWKKGVQAELLTYSDTAFAALPNGTTLKTGEILAPPASWANTSTNQRYALQVVKAPGTTGAPSGGNIVAAYTSSTSCQGAPTCLTLSPNAVFTITATSCVTSTHTMTFTGSGITFSTGNIVHVMGTGESTLNGLNGAGFDWVVLSGATSTSFSVNMPCGMMTTNSSDTGSAFISLTTDIGIGSQVAAGSILTCSTLTNGYNQISRMDASNPQAVLITFNHNMANTTAAPLVFCPPLLNNEMQIATKSSTAPTTGSWIAGDHVQNSNASPNGVADWVNVGAGAPGTWGGVPVGNSSGQLGTSQVCGGTATSGKYCDGGSDTWTVVGAVAGAPSTIAAINAPVTNTGSTTPNLVAVLTVPANSLDSTGKMVIKISGSSCTASGTPNAACTAANTGTCTPAAYFSSSNTGATGSVFIDFESVAASQDHWTSETNVRAQSSTSSQWWNSLFVQVTANTNALNIVNPTSQNMAITNYVKIFMTNSVSGDVCYLDQADVVVWP
jgi:hypothetical protein